MTGYSKLPIDCSPKFGTPPNILLEPSDETLPNPVLLAVNDADGTFKDFKTEATDPKVTNIIRGWAPLFQAKVDAGDKLSYVSEKEVRFGTLGGGGLA